MFPIDVTLAAGEPPVNRHFRQNAGESFNETPAGDVIFCLSIHGFPGSFVVFGILLVHFDQLLPGHLRLLDPLVRLRAATDRQGKEKERDQGQAFEVAIHVNVGVGGITMG